MHIETIGKHIDMHACFYLTDPRLVITSYLHRIGRVITNTSTLLEPPHTGHAILAREKPEDTVL